MAIATLSPSVDARRQPAVVTSVARCAALGLALALAALGCGNDGRQLGESCETSGECASDLQCLERACVPRCHGHVDCGDGATCNAEGECEAVTSQVGDRCQSELACGAGQTCRLSPSLGTTAGICEEERAGALEGETCTVDADCRAGGCALGRCVSLCYSDDISPLARPDCRRGWTCAAIPLVGRSTSVNACLPGNATIEFELPVPAPDPLTPGMLPLIPVPVPSTARSLVLVFEAPTENQSVGAGVLLDPNGRVIYREPVLAESYFTNPVRHAPRPGTSVLQVPSSTAAPLSGGIYNVTVHAFRDDPTVPAIGRARLHVIEKLGSAARLDLHFYFLDLADHPCNETIGTTLDATSAQTISGFQQDFLGELAGILAPANITIGEVTYDDVPLQPDLDVLDANDATTMFSLPIRSGGVSIFFVRSMEPDGQELLVGGTPGAPIPGTGASAIALGADTLCYRSWTNLARQAAHGIARHMGLFRNVEPDDIATHVDPIDDSSTSVENLMHWSDRGGTDLSLGQREILRASPVLR